MCEIVTTKMTAKIHEMLIAYGQKKMKQNDEDFFSEWDIVKKMGGKRKSTSHDTSKRLFGPQSGFFCDFFPRIFKQRRRIK